MGQATEFDYIIVGAGSAGAVLAARLSQDPDIQVAVLEAGRQDSNPFIHIPFGLAVLSRFSALNWGYSTEPQQALNNRCLFWPRGKTLGGSSAINAMCYIRGQASDYDDWEAAGAKGWSYADVLPWFRHAECFYAGADQFHGDSGPLRVEQLRYAEPMSHAFVACASHVGLAQREDFNRLERSGLGLYHVTQVNGQRCSSAKAYLSGLQGRANLTLYTETEAGPLILDNSRVNGITLTHQGKPLTLNARREVILCAGAINSPHLLLRSGIGPAKDLQAAGVTVKHHLPGVGQNLQDHLDIIVQCKAQRPHGYALAAGKLPAYIAAAWQYLRGRQGLLSSNIAEAGGFACSSLAPEDKPDLQFHFIPAILNDHGRQNSLGYGFGLHVCNLYPRSRGQITLNPAEPAAAPLIDPNYLSHPDDLRIMLDGLALARQIVHAKPMADYLHREVLPGEDVQDESALVQFIRARAETIYHPVGTCKMGAAEDPTAVLDAQFKVFGVAGLRVVDASAMPGLIGGNTNAPVIMMAERAAQFILADAPPA